MGHRFDLWLGNKDSAFLILCPPSLPPNPAAKKKNPILLVIWAYILAISLLLLFLNCPRLISSLPYYSTCPCSLIQSQAHFSRSYPQYLRVIRSHAFLNHLPALSLHSTFSYMLLQKNVPKVVTMSVHLKKWNCNQLQVTWSRFPPLTWSKSVHLSPHGPLSHIASAPASL